MSRKVIRGNIKMKKLYTYTKTEDKEGIKFFEENQELIIQLKRLIIRNADAEIPNFYAPHLRFFLLPIVWDNSGDAAQCRPQARLENLADLGNIVLTSNNSRALINQEQPIFSANEIRGSLNILLTGIVFERKGRFDKKVIEEIKRVVKKSKLGKQVSDNKLIKNSMKILFNQLRKMEAIANVHCLADYRGKELLEPDASIVLGNEKLRIELISQLQQKSTTRSMSNRIISKSNPIPNLNGRVNKTKVRDIRSVQPPSTPLQLLPSGYGKIESLLMTLPLYINNFDKYVGIIKEFAAKLNKVELVLLMELEDENISSEEQGIIDGIRARLRNNNQLDDIKVGKECQKDNFTIWSQDAFLVTQSQGHTSDNRICIINPIGCKRNNRRNDGSIAKEMIARRPSSYISQNFPMPIEGGNVLVAKDFILIGQDEIADSGFSNTGFSKKFESFFGKEKPLISVSSRKRPYEKPEELKEDKLRKVRDLKIVESFLINRTGLQFEHSIYQWLGTMQPIFHIDLFITLLGHNEQGEQRILLGQPVAGFDTEKLDEKTKELFDYQLRETCQRIEECRENLERDLQKHDIKYEIIRNCLPLTYERNGLDIVWYYATYNNCIIEIADVKNKMVWLPSYGTDKDENSEHWNYLKKYDKEHVELFEKYGFQVHLFDSNFHFLASKNGSMHCMTKCLARSKYFYPLS